MTRHDLTRELAARMNISKKNSEKFMAEFVSIVKEKVSRGEKVSLTGFGTFDLGKRAARNGIDPQTGERIKIPEMKMPRFRAGKGLKEAVRK